MCADKCRLQPFYKYRGAPSFKLNGDSQNQSESQICDTISIDLVGNKLLKTQSSLSLLRYSISSLCPLARVWLYIQCLVEMSVSCLFPVVEVQSAAVSASAWQSKVLWGCRWEMQAGDNLVVQGSDGIHYRFEEQQQVDLCIISHWMTAL